MEPSVREQMKQTMMDADIILGRIQLLAGLAKQRLMTPEEFDEQMKKFHKMLRKELGLSNDILKNNKIILLNPVHRTESESAPAEE